MSWLQHFVFFFSSTLSTLAETAKRVNSSREAGTWVAILAELCSGIVECCRCLPWTEERLECRLSSRSPRLRRPADPPCRRRPPPVTQAKTHIDIEATTREEESSQVTVGFKIK